MALISPFRAYLNKDKKIYKSIKNIFGFYPDNINLYKQAFRHSSVAKEIKKGIKNSNERLEFLGDAVISSIIADYLFKKFPYKDEGFLTEMRSKLVSRKSLNSLSTKLGLGDLLEASKDSSNYSETLKGNTLEALIGAVYIDKGYDFSRKIVVNKILKYYIDIDEIVLSDTNYKSKLLELTQKEKTTLEYKVAEIQEKSRKKVYFVEVFINDSKKGKGTGFSIKSAEQEAAKQALEQGIRQ